MKTDYFFILQMMLPVTMLPRVLWQHIASWLQGDPVLIHLRATCRWLRRIEIHQLPRCMERSLTAERLQSVTSLRRLNIYGCEDVTNEMIQCCDRLEWLCTSWTNVTWFPSTLRRLDIYGRTDVTNEMIKSCTHLEWLNASGTKVTWFPSTLRHLNIRGCNQVTTEMLAHLKDCEIAR